MNLITLPTEDGIISIDPRRIESVQDRRITQHRKVTEIRTASGDVVEVVYGHDRVMELIREARRHEGTRARSDEGTQARSDEGRAAC